MIIIEDGEILPERVPTPALHLRQHRTNKRRLMLYSPAYPEGELVAECQLEWVAEHIVKNWNANPPGAGMVR